MAEPVTVEVARGRLGIVSTHRDDEIAMLISAAREQVEDLSGHILMRRDIFEPLARVSGDRVELATFPVKAIKRLIYFDGDGNEAEVVAADMRLASSLRPLRLAPAIGGSWPADCNSPVVVLDAGYEGDADDPYPPSLIQALLTLVGLWFEDHAGEKPVPQQVRDLCQTKKSWLC